MAKKAVNLLLNRMNFLAGQSAASESDSYLLERFIRQQDEAAFAALVERHGSMVLGVCQRSLPDEHLAEDVFQATFLVLIRNAGTIRKGSSLVSWLHGVALRLARKARANMVRAGKSDQRPRPESPPDPAAEVNWREVRQILDDELQRLPESYRLPLILCYLEGRTRDEAAMELGWTPSRLKGLLERGRQRLRQRLIARGLAPSTVGVILLAETTLAAPVPPLLFIATLQAALCLALGRGLHASGVSGTVIKLAEGGVGIMRTNKVLMNLLIAVSLGIVGTGTALWAQHPGLTPQVDNAMSVSSPLAPEDRPEENKQSKGETKQVWREKATLRETPPPVGQDGVIHLPFVRFSPNGKSLAVANSPSTGFALLDLATGRDLTHAANKKMRQEPRFLGFTRDGKAVGSQVLADGPTPVGSRLVDWVNGEELWRITDILGQVSLSPDGKLLGGTNARGGVSLWSADTGKKLATLPTAPTTHFGFLLFSPDCKTLATAGTRHAYFDGTPARSEIKLWDVATCMELKCFALEGRQADNLHLIPLSGSGEESTRAMRFTPDGKRLAITCGAVLPDRPSRETVLQFWDVEHLKENGQFRSKEHGPVKDYDISPDGKTVVIAWAGGAEASKGQKTPDVYIPGPVTILDMATGKEVGKLEPPSCGFAAVAFSPDGLLLATQDNKGVIKVWERLTVNEETNRQKPVEDKPKPKPEDTDRKYEFAIDATQPAGSPILLKLIWTNTGKEPIRYWWGGPGDYPPLGAPMKAKITDAEGKTREAQMSNGQALGGSGIHKTLEVCDSVVIPAVIAPLPKGNYVIEFRGATARIKVDDDAELLKKHDEDLLARVITREYFARHVFYSYITPSLLDICLKKLSSNDVDTAVDYAWLLEHHQKLPPSAVKVLARAFDKWFTQPRAQARWFALGSLADLASRIGTDEALELVLKVNNNPESEFCCIGALGSFKQERATKELHALLKDKDEHRRLTTARTLAEKGDRAAIDALVAIAEDTESSFRAGACHALVLFPNEARAEAAIRSCLFDPQPPQLADEAKSALKRLEEARKK